MSEQLKPCPFCGSKAELLNDGTVAECSQDFLDELTVEEWNTRPIEDKLRAKIESLIRRLGQEHGFNDDLRAENERLVEQLDYKPGDTVPIAKLRIENEQLKRGAGAIEVMEIQDKLEKTEAEDSELTRIYAECISQNLVLKAENERLKDKLYGQGNNLPGMRERKLKDQLEKAKGAFSEIYKKAILIMQLNDILDREEMVEQALQIQKIAEGHK